MNTYKLIYAEQAGCLILKKLYRCRIITE